MVTGPRRRTPGARHHAAGRALGSFAAAVLLVAGVAQCGGRSLRTGEDDGANAGGGDAPASGGAFATGGRSTTGGASFGGGTSGGSASGGSASGGVAGEASDPYVRCRQPMVTGPCLADAPSYWFDASTGVCMPFTYGGCDGNDNRFATLKECYATCGLQGDHALAMCMQSADCRAVRLGEPCCRLDVRDFVAVTLPELFPCTDPAFCRACPADCDFIPQDGYIGATCEGGFCIPFNLLERGGAACATNSDCRLRFGVECCEQCSPGQGVTKLVAINATLDIEAIACAQGLECGNDDCDTYGAEAICASGTCQVVLKPF